MNSWSPAAEIAAKQPSSSLDAFALTPQPPRCEFDIAVVFAVNCRRCGAAVFRISAYPLVARNPSADCAVEQDELIWLPPHSLTCVECGEAKRIFDIRTDGYDAILNAFASYESGDVGEEFVSGAFNVEVSTLYNIELKELVELSAEAKVQPADLFDFFSLHGKSIDGNADFFGDYECA